MTNRGLLFKLTKWNVVGNKKCASVLVIREKKSKKDEFQRL